MKRPHASAVSIALVCASTLVLVAQAAPAGQGTVDVVPVYRFYFSPAQTHFYSTNPQIPGNGWQGEGIAFYVSPVALPYAVPLFSLYKASLLDHFYTIGPQAASEAHTLHQYADQGVLGYVLPPDKDLPGTAPLYRWVRVYAKAGSQDHFYQTSAAPPSDYQGEGIECRVWTGKVSLPSNRLLLIGSPKAGETWHVGRSKTISWTVFGGGGFIKLSYSKNNGASWKPIDAVANVGNFGSMNDGSYPWTVPADAQGKILVRADWAKESSGAEPPWAMETSPAVTVKPDVTPVPYMPADRGKLLERTDQPLLVPPTPAPVRVAPKAMATAKVAAPDRSVLALVKVLFPAGGETLQTGATYQVKWSTGGAAGNVKLALAKGVGRPDLITPAGGVSNSGVYPWTIPSDLAPASDYKLGVVVSGSGDTVWSNTFTVSKPELVRQR